MIACDECKRSKCAYEGNQYALERVGKKGSCPFNQKVMVVEDTFKLNPLKASKRSVKR